MSAECHVCGTDIVYPEGSWPVGECPACNPTITDDMIQRAARVCHANAEHRMPSGKLSRWADLTSFQHHQFRTQAKAVLRAAFREDLAKED